MEIRAEQDRDTQGASLYARHGAPLGWYKVTEGNPSGFCTRSSHYWQHDRHNSLYLSPPHWDTYSFTETLLARSDMASGPYSPCIGWSASADDEDELSEAIAARYGQAIADLVAVDSDDGSTVEDCVETSSYPSRSIRLSIDSWRFAGNSTVRRDRQADQSSGQAKT